MMTQKQSLSSLYKHFFFSFKLDGFVYRIFAITCTFYVFNKLNL